MGQVNRITLRHIHQMKGNQLIDNYTYNKFGKKVTISYIKQYKRNYCVPDLAHAHIHRTMSLWNFPQSCGF